MRNQIYPRNPITALLAAALICGAGGEARAASKSAPLQLKIYPHLTVAVTPTQATVHCDAPPGTVIAAISSTGGNGKPVGYALTAGDTADFAIADGKVVAGPNGLAANQCGQAPFVTVTASQ
jgi:hypothetical protein